MKEEAQDEHTKNMLCFSKLYSQIDGITVCFWLVFFRPEQAFTRGWKVQMSIMLKRIEHEGWGMRLSACCVGARIRTDGANPCEKEAQVSWGLRTVAEKDTGSSKVWWDVQGTSWTPRISLELFPWQCFFLLPLSHVRTGGAFTQAAPFLLILLVEAAADLAVKSLVSSKLTWLLVMQALLLWKVNWHSQSYESLVLLTWIWGFLNLLLQFFCWWSWLPFVNHFFHTWEETAETALLC